MVIKTALTAAALAGLAASAGAATIGPRVFTSRALPVYGTRPFIFRPEAASSTIYTFGGTLAATQWRTWFKPAPAGCYAASGTGAAQGAFLGGGLAPTTETVTAPQTADCVSPNTGSIRYPEVDFSAGDAPLSVAQNNSYKSSSVYSKRGFARVAPVAGASLSEAFHTSGLPGNLTISNAQLCGIWKGTIVNWTAVTNQATGKPASTSSLPISLVYRTDGSGSTFIHTAHLNAVCSGGYTPVGTSFPTGAAGKAKLIGAVGSGGVASAIAANSGAIGYVAPNSLVSGDTSAAIENKSSQYYTPTSAAITAAFTSPTDTTPPSGYPAATAQQTDLYLTNPSKSGSYAEVGFTYAFLYTCYPTTFGVSAANVMKKFTGTVYASGAVTQTGLVNLGSTSKADALKVVEGIMAGSTFNPSTGKCS